MGVWLAFARDRDLYQHERERETPMNALLRSAFPFLVVLVHCSLANASGTIEVPYSECTECTNVSALNERMQEIANAGHSDDCKWDNGDGRKCMRTDSPATVSDAGVTMFATDIKLCSSCDERCGNKEATQPAPRTCNNKLVASVTYTESTTVTGKIAGPTFIALITAELQVAASSGTTTGCNIEDSVSVTPPSCTWERTKLEVSYKNGKKAKIIHTWAKMETIVDNPPNQCPYEGEKVYQSGCGPTDESTITVNGICTSSGTITAAGGGSCPPAAPAM